MASGADPNVFLDPPLKNFLFDQIENNSRIAQNSPTATAVNSRLRYLNSATLAIANKKIS